MADALAIVPLCLKLLSECFRGYQIFTQANELGKSSQKLFWKFKIQEARLRIWAKEWGLIEGHHNQPTGQVGRDADDYKIVAETLVRVSELFRDQEQLQARYGLKLVTETGIWDSAKSPSLPTTIATLAGSPRAATTPLDALQRDTDLSNLFQQDLDLTSKRGKATTLLGKLHWAVSDRNRFETMISDLRDYNDGLYCLLSAVERRRLRQALAPELVPKQQKIDTIKELGGASTEYQDLAGVAALAVQRLCLESPETSGAARAASQRRLQIEGNRISFDLQEAPNSVPTHADRAIASLSEPHGAGKRVVLVEWKSYDKSLGEALREQQLQRLRDVAALLNVDNKPPSLHVPHCIGYFSDNWHPRVGFVFEYGGYTPPWSLQDVLGGNAIPYVGDRFRLAHELSLSVSILHSAGWLHKGIRSDNIIFSSPVSRTTHPPQLDHPLLLGFEYARPNTHTAFSETIDSLGPQALLYRHPQCIDTEGQPRTRFEPAHDVYSLGVILLEIGLWRSAEELYAKLKYTGRFDPRFGKDLLRHHTPLLGGKMGKIYMEVVTACLSGEYTKIDQITQQTGSNEQEKFYWAVVNPLSKLVA